MLTELVSNMNYWGVFYISMLLLLIQGSVLPLLLFGKWQPDIFLTVLLLISLIFERKQVLVFAVVFGIVQDVIIGNFFGLHVFPYVIVSWVVVQFIKKKYNKHWYVSLLTVLLGSLCYFIFSGFIVWQGESYYLLNYYLELGLPFALCNSILAFFLHKLLWKFRRDKEIRW